MMPSEGLVAFLLLAIDELMTEACGTEGVLYFLCGAA
jgi:hypothetical protein